MPYDENPEPQGCRGCAKFSREQDLKAFDGWSADDLECYLFKIFVYTMLETGQSDYDVLKFLRDSVTAFMLKAILKGRPDD